MVYPQAQKMQTLVIAINVNHSVTETYQRIVNLLDLCLQFLMRVEKRCCTCQFILIVKINIPTPVAVVSYLKKLLVLMETSFEQRIHLNSDNTTVTTFKI